jgi:lysyl-tRNA synthetase class 2
VKISYHNTVVLNLVQHPDDQTMSPFFRQTRLIENLGLRAGIINAVRQFFIENGYLEVDTPVRIPAPAPERHIDAQTSGDWFLQTSPELCMKQLLAAGYERIFQICKCFRAGERGTKHLPEFTLLEWYTAGEDYTHMMDQCETLIGFILGQLSRDKRIVYHGHAVDLLAPWDRMTVSKAFARFGSVSMEAALERNRFDEVMGLEIEPRLGLKRPLFLVDYPAQCGALARVKPQQPHVAERFELYIAGVELCNGFSELTDPAEQRRRFEKEMGDRRCDGKPHYPMPERFLEALEHMPASTGNALGIDRLVMLMAGTPHIDDVVAFPPEAL